MHIYSKGPRSASVLIVGEAPGENEVKQGLPFVGTSGEELDKMLSEAGYDPESVRVTNVCHERPPKNKIENFLTASKKAAKELNLSEFENGFYFGPPIRAGLNILEMEIASLPNLRQIIGLGNTPLWALTGQRGISKWRGSQMFSKLRSQPTPFIPIYHPAYILRMWEDRWVAVHDLKRAKRWDTENYAIPNYEFIVRPSFACVCDWLNNLLAILDSSSIKIAVDIETRDGQIACIGLATSPRSAICIPLFTTSKSYWSPDEAGTIVWLLYKVLRKAECIGQNFLYDQQYIARRWGFLVRLFHDTMLKQHILMPGVAKGLDFLSSLYCSYHTYWKDESKDWNPSLGEEQLWIYNCKDAVVTFEANEALSQLVSQSNLDSQLRDQMEDCDIALEMMLRGINVNLERKRKVSKDLEIAMISLMRFINRCVKMDLPEFSDLSAYEKLKRFNPASPTQVHSLAYEVLKLPPQWKRTDDGGRRPTADKEAIEVWLGTVEPIYRPLLQAIADYRSLQVFRSTFAEAALDDDGRWRCSVKVAGPETFRWATAKDAFGFGSNMQNIPKGDED